MLPVDSPFARVVRLGRTGSTNADLRAAALADPPAWPHGAVLVADHQDAGRGRAGRTWQTPAGTALTASVLLRPGVPAETFGWLPLLVGLAVQRATSALVPGAGVSVKWPNDVVAAGAGDDDVEGWGHVRKLAGILVEALPAPPPAAVAGIGVNVAQSAGELPVPWATSLRLLGSRAEVPEVLDAVGGELMPLLRRWSAAGGDVETAGLHAEVSAACTTLGTDVRVDLPGGSGPSGRAVGLDRNGHLLVDTGEAVTAVAAGDVHHLRAAG